MNSDQGIKAVPIRTTYAIIKRRYKELSIVPIIAQILPAFKFSYPVYSSGLALYKFIDCFEITNAMIPNIKPSIP